MMYRGNLLLVLESASILQEIDHRDMKNLDLFRLTTTVVKAFTAKDCMSVISEGLECFGGLGYMENSGIPRILRDAQVTPIWEGTTSTLSLDFAHSLFKKPKVYI